VPRKGINITQLTSSNKFFDMTGDGQQELTAWAGVGNGVLFFDPTGTAKAKIGCDPPRSLKELRHSQRWEEDPCGGDTTGGFWLSCRDGQLHFV
jgi:hypothetical protein